METIQLIGVFIFGSIVGSFLNVCIYRLPREKSLWKPSRSYCPHCHEMIAWHDNIPLISYFALNAQCRHCGSHIAGRYVVVEFLTAVLFTVTFAMLRGRGEGLPVTAVYMAMVGALIAGSFIDIELRIIPNSITIGGMVLAPILSIMIPELHSDSWSHFGRGYVFFKNNHLLGPLAASVVGAAAGAGITWVFGVLGKLIFRREAMGFGDVKLMAFIGGLLGWQQALLVFFVAPIFGLTIALIHLLRTKDHHIPYGPFLSIAAWATILAGDRIFALVQLDVLMR